MLLFLRGELVKGIIYPRVDTAGLDQARQAGEFLRNKYESANAIVLGVNALFDKLQFGPDSAETFEQALADLGLHLGFRAQRPEKLGVAGLDVLWGVGDRQYLLLPCKSEATVGTISKAYADQLSGSAAWFSQAYDHTCQAVPVIVHPAQTLDKLAAAPLHSRVITVAKLEGLKASAKNFILAAKDQLDNQAHLRAVLNSEKLLGPQIVSQHTLPVKAGS